jgi:hypothetical protein
VRGGEGTEAWQVEGSIAAQWLLRPPSPHFPLTRRWWQGGGGGRLIPCPLALRQQL